MDLFKKIIVTSLVGFFLMQSIATTAQKKVLPYNQQIQIKSDALEVLRTKCNTCHRWMNSSKIFTKENMDTFSDEIDEQVFVYKKMPKGKKRRKKMTEEEFLALKKWLEVTEDDK